MKERSLNAVMILLRSFASFVCVCVCVALQSIIIMSSTREYTSGATRDSDIALFVVRAGSAIAIILYA